MGGCGVERFTPAGGEIGTSRGLISLVCSFIVFDLFHCQGIAVTSTCLSPLRLTQFHLAFFLLAGENTLVAPPPLPQLNRSGLFNFERRRQLLSEYKTGLERLESGRERTRSGRLARSRVVGHERTQHLADRSSTARGGCSLLSVYINMEIGDSIISSSVSPCSCSLSHR